MRLVRFPPQPSPGELASAIILSQLALLALLALVYLKLRRRRVPPHIVAAFEEAFLSKEDPCRK